MDKKAKFSIHSGFNIWPVESVARRPQILLSQWRMYEVSFENSDEVSCHLVGRPDEQPSGRVSSPIVSIDPATRCCVSQSGRAYFVVGTPGSCSDARYVWHAWKTLCLVKTERDLSMDLESLFEQTQKHSTQ
ncbi:hypothetical protein dqs_0016 [Azoarcus olearius]|nr:hypothetical protein dqs_0016 [Azoarcus olearius]